MEGDRDILKHLHLTGVRPSGRNIGVGAYGRVFEVELCGELYAAKEIHSVLIEGVEREGFERMRNMFIAECLQSSILGHENVVRVLGVYNAGGRSLLPVLVMERMQESLTSLAENHPNIAMYVKLSILLDVSRGLWYLHSHDPPIVHRDLSPNNVLLTSQFVAKISDLGVAKVIKADSKKTRAPGTVDFMPPEALQLIPEYGPSLDVFSYGGVILHTINQEWPTPLHYVMSDHKTETLLALSEVKRRQEHIAKIPGYMQQLASRCLKDDPNGRPLISDVSGQIVMMKDAEHARCPHVNTDPTTWTQAEQTTNTVTPTAKTQKQTSTMQQIDIFGKSLKVTWKEVAPMPVCRTVHMAVMLHGVVYVAGGYEGNCISEKKKSFRLDVYIPSINQWSPPITTPSGCFAMTAMDDRLVIAGGEIIDKEIIDDVFVLDAGQWKNLSKLPTARSHATAVWHQHQLIVMGGQVIKVNHKRMIVSTIEVLDTTSGCWHTCDDLPKPNRRISAAVINDTLYLLGGREEDSPSHRMFSASLVNLSSHRFNWQSLPDTPWCYSTSIVLCDNYLLTVGGRKRFDGNSQTNEICAFDVSTSLWKVIALIPEARSFPAVAVLSQNDIIAMGGAINDEKYTKVACIGTFQ